MSIQTSFRGKLFALAIAPLTVAMLVTLLAVMRTVESDVETRAKASLEISGNVVAEYLAARDDQLQNSVQVLAADFGLKEAAATEDAATIRSVLRNHSLRIGADLALYTDVDRRLIASTDDRLITDMGAAVEDLPLLDARDFVMTIDGDYYLAYSVPVMAPVAIGRVVLAFRVDAVMLDRLRSLTGLEVNVVRRGEAAPGTVLLSGDGEWLTLYVPFAESPHGVHIQLRRSMQDAMQTYRQARSALMLLGVLLLGIVSLGAGWLSGSLAQPLRRLTDAAKHMASGNYATVVDIPSNDELGELAESFNAMRTAIAEREERISHLAMHDSLTGLPNRNMLLQRLEHAIADSGENLHICVLSIRLIGMDSISSTLGHVASDEVIRQAARHLSANLDDEEILGHVGTHEFVVIVPDGDASGVIGSADRIENILGTGVKLGRINIALQTEIGVADYPEHADNAADLLRNAAIARSEAGSRNERVAVYQVGSEQHYVRQLKIVNDLRTTLQKEELVLCFQPKVSLQNGQISGAEALVRWQHPELGLLLPDSFIPAAEQSGTILLLTRYVLTHALRACKEWEDRGIVTGVSVNLSARDLHDEYLPYFVLQELKEAGVSADRLTLEITENSVMHDLNHALSVLQCLRDIGVRISIDDFGTGHSSLAQLKNMPVHELKIDKSFIMNLVGDQQDAAIVTTIIELAHNMSLDVVAEGVEDKEILSRLGARGCEHAQGYFFSKPIPTPEFIAWCEAYEPVALGERRRRERAFADRV